MSAAEPDLGNLNATLKQINLDLCETYHWIEDMEMETRAQIEQRNDMAFPDREEKLTFIRDQKWAEYCQKHKLPDSVRLSINVYGVEACK